MTINIHYPLKPVPSTLPIDLNINSTSPALKITQTGTGNALVVQDSANPDGTPFIIDTDGVVLRGLASKRTNTINGFSAGLQLEGSATSDKNVASIGRGVDAAIILARQNGVSNGDNTIISSGNSLGAVYFSGADGTGLVSAGRIIGYSDGTPGAGSMPGAIRFDTTPTGSTTSIQRMTINSLGNVGIGSTNLTSTSLNVAKALTGNSTATGISSQGPIQSDVISEAQMFISNPSTVAASFTLSNLIHYYANQGTLGVGSAVDTQYGFYVRNTLIGANNNFGFFSNISALNVTAGSFVIGKQYKITSIGTTDFTLIGASSNTIGVSFVATGAGTGNGTADLVGRWNFVANGSAENLFNGNTIINVSSGLPALRITQSGFGDCLLVEDSSNPDSTPFVIDGNGNVIKGFNTQLSIASETDGASLSPGSEIVGLGFTPSSQAFINFTNSTTNARGAFLSFARSNGSSIGTHTIVSDANELGVIGFQGSDGTSFVRSASIKAIVDGAPGSSSMPGRLVFSTTPSGSTTPSERLRIDNQGRIGISSGTLTGYCVRNALNITGATTSFGIGNTSVIQSDVTTLGVYYYANVQTAAASFTLSNLYCYQASQGTFGVGSTVTNLHGYVASSTLVGGANNNFGFYGNIPAQSVTAGSFVNGSSYKITSLGTTDFTLIGATSNTLGLFFTATGAGTGTGTADKVGRFNFFANGTAENRFQGNTVIDVSTGLDALRVTQRGAGNALVIEDSTNPDSSPFVIDAAGLVVCGFTENIDGYQIQSHNGNPLSGFRWSASSGGATVALKKSRSTTINSFSIVSSGDTIGSYEFFGDDGAAFQRAARISAAVDAAPAAGSMPGRLTFLTTPTSSTTPSERMRIDSVGFVGINKPSPTSQLHLGATAGVADSGTIGLDEKDTTPANPASGTACKIYMKADKFIIQYNDAGTVRYKYLDLTGTGVTWVATTTAP